MPGERPTASRRPARRRRLALAAVAALALGVAPAEASAQCATYGCEPYTFLLSSSASGGMPNGPSRNAAISQDERIGRVAAFESDASNIVGGETNGHTDVFTVLRRSP